MDKFENYKDLGLTGLANIGNTCYLNSCMQLLSHTYELNDFLKNNKRELNNVTESTIFSEWNKLREMMWSENCSIAPYGFVKAIQDVAKEKKIEIFEGYAQNDVFEFLLFIIDCFHESLKRQVEMKINGFAKNETDILAKKCYEMMRQMYNKDYSEIINLFYGISVTQIKDYLDNKMLSVACEPFSILSLSIPGKNECSILDCFDLYTKGELLVNENAWFNDATNEKQDVVKDLSFWKLPDILILELKRYSNNNRKINTVVNSPIENLDLSKYVSGYNKEEYIYDLYGPGNHMGNVFGGHYTANVKNANGKWYRFNDTLINEIKENEVINANTYCLFYRKKNKDYI